MVFIWDKWIKLALVIFLAIMSQNHLLGFITLYLFSTANFHISHEKFSFRFFGNEWQTGEEVEFRGILLIVFFILRIYFNWAYFLVSSCFLKITSRWQRCFDIHSGLWEVTSHHARPRSCVIYMPAIFLWQLDVYDLCRTT